MKATGMLFFILLYNTPYLSHSKRITPAALLDELNTCKALSLSGNSLSKKSLFKMVKAMPVSQDDTERVKVLQRWCNTNFQMMFECIEKSAKGAQVYSPNRNAGNVEDEHSWNDVNKIYNEYQDTSYFCKTDPKGFLKVRDCLTKDQVLGTQGQQECENQSFIALKSKGMVRSSEVFKYTQHQNEQIADCLERLAGKNCGRQRVDAANYLKKKNKYVKSRWNSLFPTSVASQQPVKDMIAVLLCTITGILLW